MPLILDLCGGTGAWSKPYREAGYQVETISLPRDVRLEKRVLSQVVHGILAAPPCNHFSMSGARWWAGKGDAALLEGLSIVDACLRAVMVYKPAWWALENPIGRLIDYLGQPVMTFQPCDFGDPYTKQTCLWGSFRYPIMSPVAPTEGSKMHRMSSTQKEERAVTPAGFARAFFEANP
jgi:hypothetical protein